MKSRHPKTSHVFIRLIAAALLSLNVAAQTSSQRHLNAGRGASTTECDTPFGRAAVLARQPSSTAITNATALPHTATNRLGSAFGNASLTTVGQLVPATRSIDFGLKTPSFDLPLGKSELTIPSFTIVDFQSQSVYTGGQYRDTFRSTQLGPIKWEDKALPLGGILVSYDAVVRKCLADLERVAAATNTVPSRATSTSSTK